MIACLWAGRGRGLAGGAGLRVRGLDSHTGGYGGRVPVDLLTGLEGVNSGILLGGFWLPPLAPVRSGACAGGTGEC